MSARQKKTMTAAQRQIDTSQLTFMQAVGVACDLLPGLRSDLNQNQQHRNAQARDMQGIGRIALSIPEPIEPLLRIYHPELYQADAELRGKAWLRFMKHPDSAPFRTYAKL